MGRLVKKPKCFSSYRRRDPIQASIALKMDLAKEYYKKMKMNEQRFLK